MPRKRPAILGGAPAFADFVYFTRPRAPDAARFAELVAGIFQSRQFTNDGKLVRELQERLAARLGVEWCALVCNGTTALQLACAPSI
jgi:dTDP-4-amino-4,6-dideoxygalactose transaminase